KRLCALRQDKELTQKTLAKAAGVTAAMLSKYENGTNVPKADVVARMADVLDTTADYLVGRTNDPAPTLSHDRLKELTEEEKKLLLVYSHLNRSNRIRLMERAHMLLEDQERLRPRRHVTAASKVPPPDKV
ncbi:MAG: helix-turn-helix transcriptional regulator, partial [Clostridiales bacterium]|nr:helix-turn-helix transcriptional regulator [Clostridiales bacterium]